MKIKAEAITLGKTFSPKGPLHCVTSQNALMKSRRDIQQLPRA